MNHRQGPTRIVTESKHTDRNLPPTSIDQLARARERGKRGHRLIRVPGRGYVVVRRASGRIGAGPLLIAGGIGAVAPEFSLTNIGRVLIVVGVVLFCFQRHREEQRGQIERLMESNTASNATYDLGYDQGYEAGYQACREESRPKLVDLGSRRGEAGKDKVLSPVSSVVDRG